MFAIVISSYQGNDIVRRGGGCGGCSEVWRQRWRHGALPCRSDMPSV